MAEIIPYLFAALSLALAVVAFTKLADTSSGILIGGCSAASGLLSIAGRLVRGLLDEPLPMVFATSVLQLGLAFGVAIGVFLLPASIEALAARSSGAPARW